MKAIQFLEWWLKQGADRTNESFEIKVANFLNRPFKPEMITELFEGFTKNVEEGYTYKTQDGNDFQLRLSQTMLVIYGHFSGLPSVIDQFISDCQRAGIELDWKPEIVKEYFT
jgi:hypothetical protein